MKILFGVTGAVIGLVFGSIATLAVVESLSDGNTLGEAFQLMYGAPIGLLGGTCLGAAMALRVGRLLREKPTSGFGRRRRCKRVLGLLLGLPAAFGIALWAARTATEPPTDARMLRHFERDAPLFERLIEMANADK